MRGSFWSSDIVEADSAALFRGSFLLEGSARVQILTVGASWYQAWLDGKWVFEGPFRYPLDKPEFQVEEASLAAGVHVLALHVRHDGVETRILKETPPYVCCRLLVDGREISLTWKALGLTSQACRTRRINPQLGWMECRDTRLEPAEWNCPDYDDSTWGAPVSGASELPEPTLAKLSPVQTAVHELRKCAEGPLATMFGYPADEPAYSFYSRDRSCTKLPVQGVWRRYDLGRIRLGRAALSLDVPAGTVIEIAYAEELTEGRVSPFINFSAGASCNLDRFIARGGEQTFSALVPKGGRYVEVHVVNALEGVRFVREEYLERGYHAPTEAGFSCGDSVLEKIWLAGVETYRACAEDAIVDNPTRERGQWVGDAAAAGIENAAAAFHDLRLARRALVHAAQCPREDGLVAAMAPGGCCHMTTYAFLWVVAVQKYFRYTGDRELLEEMWPHALRNMAAIEPFMSADGMRNEAGQIFVDWGYRTEEPTDTATNLFLLWALREMVKWAQGLGKNADAFMAREKEVAQILEGRLRRKFSSGGWAAIGYHCSALGLLLGLIEDEEGCLNFMAAHILDCFPNDPTAPRNDDPLGVNPRLITPYFAHYVFPLFIERGRMDFVLEQYRTCWGWMLQEDRSTMLEVFDTRWSHCHQWSACPTWQMSRYLLGLHPRWDLGAGTFDLRLEPGSLPRAKGRLPHAGGGWINVEWERTREGIVYSCEADSPLQVLESTLPSRCIEAGKIRVWKLQEGIPR